MVRRIGLFLAGLVFSLGTYAQHKPKVVVGIVVSHFYPEWLEWYEQDLGSGGFKRLMKQAATLSMNYNYFYTQVGVDHASIYTGMLPSEHGIVSRAWYDRLRKNRQYSALSGMYHEIGTGTNAYGLSPDFLQTISLGSAMKMNNAQSKVYGIAMNGDEAVFSGGSSADLAIWFNERNGKWISSDYYKPQLPDWLDQFNANVESDSFVAKGWMSLANESSGGAKLRNRIGLTNGFYYDIARTKREYNTYRVLKATPHANTLVRMLAERLIDEERLGQDNDPDLLTLNFSCLDYMHRDFTVDSEEEKDVVLRLDKDLEYLFAHLDAKVGKDNYTVFLTFSEMRELLPEDLRKMKVNSDYFSITKAVALLKSYLGLLYGPGDWIVDYDQGQIYLNRDLVEKNKLDLKEMQDKVANLLIDFEGVSKVITAYSLTHTAFPTGANQLVQNSFYHKRSGDVMFCLHPTWVSELKEIEDMYFRHSKRPIVPLYLYGAGLPSGLKGNYEMSDLLPTLCRILKIPVPYTAKGKPMF